MLNVRIFVDWYNEKIYRKEQLDKIIDKEVQERAKDIFTDILSDEPEPELFEEIWEVLNGSQEKRNEFINRMKGIMKDDLSHDIYSQYDEVYLHLSTEDVSAVLPPIKDME